MQYAYITINVVELMLLCIVSRRDVISIVSHVTFKASHRTKAAFMNA